MFGYPDEALSLVFDVLLPNEFLAHHQAMIIGVFYDLTEAPRSCVRGARLVFTKVHAVPHRHAGIFHGC